MGKRGQLPVLTSGVNMDFSKLQGVNFDSSNGNGTKTSSLTTLPNNILEAVIPGYGLISKVILDLFGFDIGIVVSTCLIVFGFSKAFKYVWDRAYNAFYENFSASVYIEQRDQLFRHVIEWTSKQRMAQIARDIKAVSRYRAWDPEDEEDDNDDDGLDETGIFNYGKWASKRPPRYEPYYGIHRFWFQGRLYYFKRSKVEKQDGWGRSYDQEYIKVTCIGRSTKPIKELLYHIKQWSASREKSVTDIWRPTGKEERKGYPWESVASRPSRPMSTVSLDSVQKAMIVRDINEYLHPATSKWYAARGIPYRRGYLFHGPPGTGKTSLSFALAGIFGLDIFCISLMEPTLSESELDKLFSYLPRRCIVLLEDIDSAGLRRSKADEEEEEKNKEEEEKKSTNEGEQEKKDEGEETLKVKDLAKALKDLKSSSKKGKNGKELPQMISLSGLLNAIDGVATHEGRVLIMTTNHPEKLDAALIRPGRVDLQVQFSFATTEQVRDIFIRMYSTENDGHSKSWRKLMHMNDAIKTTSSGDLANDSAEMNGSAKANGSAKQANGRPMLNLPDSEKLKEMADEFTSKIPEGQFTPAEIQGFLLMRKKEPSKALEDVEKWRDELIHMKEEKSKIVKVQ